MTSAPPVEHLPSEEQPGAQEVPHHHRRGFTFTAWWALYLLTLRQHLHGKKWIVLAVLFLLPAALTIFVRATSPDVPGIWLEFSFAYLFIPQALLPLVGLIYASGMIQDEQEEQTLTYLLMRPIPKWALYGLKLLATLTTTLVLTALFTSVTYAAIYFGGNKQGHDVVHRCLITIGIHSLAITAYCSLFGFLSLLTRRTLIVGILYAAMVEGLLANLPLSVRLITVIYYSRILAYRTLPFVMSSPAGKQDLAAPVWHLDPTSMIEHPPVRDCILVLLLSSAALTIIAAYLCRRREFHVKTPEKP